jgi:hypothetical protein
VAKAITSTVTDASLELNNKVEAKKIRLRFELNSKVEWFSQSKLYSFHLKNESP